MVLATACQSTTNKVTKLEVNKPATVSYANPRPQICIKEYIPVCATKHTGVRCVTTPCPSIEKVTYPNACSACADSKVYSYIIGACQG